MILYKVIEIKKKKKNEERRNMNEERRNMNKKDENSNKTNINDLRTSIENIDFQILDLIFERMLISEKIGLIKKETNQPIFNQTQNDIVIKRAEEIADEKNMDKIIIKNIFEQIMKMSIKKQEEVIQGLKTEEKE